MLDKNPHLSYPPPLDVDEKLIQSVRSGVAQHVERTPLYRSQTFSRILDAEIHLKLESMQFTGSFKERGTVSKLNSLNEDVRQRGVIAMSAGNHAQSVARHAQRMGIDATVVMPRTTPASKVEKTQYFKPEIVLTGSSLDETLSYTYERAENENLTLLHPFDDPYVIAGQGTLGLEVIDQLPDVDTIVVPVGGGGLISGIAVAAKSVKPNVRVVGVQTELYPTTYERFKGERVDSQQSQVSIAEGIAVKQPGTFTMALIDKWVDDMVVVPDVDIETAIFQLMDIEKTVAEGAGAASIAAVAKHPHIARGKTVCIVSGGNIDMSMLSAVLQRYLTRTDRIVRLYITLQDVPGALARLASDIGKTDSNIVDVFHRRNFGSSTVGATVVEISIQLRGEDSKQSLVEKLRASGHDVVSQPS